MSEQKISGPRRQQDAPEASSLSERGLDPQRQGKFATFLVRTATSVVYVFVYLGALFLGPLATSILFAAVAGFCAFEFYDLMRSEGKIGSIPVGVAGAIAFPLAAHFWGAGSLAATASIILAVSFIQYSFSLRTRFSDISVTFIGAIYTGFCLSFLVLVRSAEPKATGALLVGAILLSVWANDSFAYMFGSLFGRHKMAPKISPKKSWEGFFAGIVGSTLIWLVIPLIPGVHLAWGWAIVGGIGCGIGGVIGDLVESRMKREAGVKDSGNILPGHGGFLDRTDSMLLVSIVSFFVLHLAGVV